MLTFEKQLESEAKRPKYYLYPSRAVLCIHADNIQSYSHGNLGEAGSLRFREDEQILCRGIVDFW